ncbi:MAG: beta-glucuronidase [Thermoflexales bacterium]|nr:beta-glucuronidase [Thermoflexales bacterium]
MLYPQSNPFRQLIDLSGFWDLRFDPAGQGEQSGWAEGLKGGRPVAVPASWNDQFEDGRDYLGNTWYQTHFDLPWGWEAARQRTVLRFDSVNYMAEVWLNGVRLGQHEGGHLPFEFDVTPQLKGEGNLLVVRVDGELAPDRVPPGNVPLDPRYTFANQNYPPTTYDFFPFCGIQRPVLLYTVPRQAIADVAVVTEIAGSAGIVRVKLDSNEGDGLTARVAVRGTRASAQTILSGGPAQVELRVPEASFWSPDSPHLYELVVELARGDEIFDRYTVPIGIRTVQVEGDALLLNGKPIYLRGFGRHEDFPVLGRGLAPAVIVKDYALMKWMGANSFRTTHYPYSDQMMDLADRLGFLVIDETPAVGLFFAPEGLERRLQVCRQYVQELVARDKNHPSVIMWSLANEPHSRLPEAKPFFRNLYELCRSLDQTRPITLVSQVGEGEESFEFLDLMCLNRYYGWYSEPGQLEAGLPRLAAEMDAMHARYNKPLVVTEFGADAIPGHHAQPPEMFSEEFQAELLTRYIELFKTRPFVVGEHVWNLCDFKTAQAVHRTGSLNFKGVFTRERRPKLAAHRLREVWQN